MNLAIKRKLSYQNIYKVQEKLEIHELILLKFVILKLILIFLL